MMVPIRSWFCRVATPVVSRQSRIASRWLETRTTGPRKSRKESADYEQTLRRDMIANPTSPMASNATPLGSGVGGIGF